MIKGIFFGRGMHKSMCKFYCLNKIVLNECGFGESG